MVLSLSLICSDKLMFCVSMITVLKHTLDSRGVTGQLKSRIRAEVHNALDDRVSVGYISATGKLSIP